jgi:hypothetical protein
MEQSALVPHHAPRRAIKASFTFHSSDIVWLPTHLLIDFELNLAEAIHEFLKHLDSRGE